jgi:PAS domain S-box-containing protein
VDKAKGDLHNAAGDVKNAARNLAKYSSGVNAIDPLPLRAGLHKAKPSLPQRKSPACVPGSSALSRTKMISQGPRLFTDLRPTRSQVEALLADVVREHSHLHRVLDAFHANGLLSEAGMPDDNVVDKEGRYYASNLARALRMLEAPLRDRIILLLTKPGRHSPRSPSPRLVPLRGRNHQISLALKIVGIQCLAGNMAGNGIETLDDTRRLQLLIDGVVDYALYLISPQGKVVSWNTGARRLKGYTADEIVGKPYATFFTHEDVRRGIPDAALSAATRDGRWEGEGWRVRKDGTRFWAMAVLDAVYDKGEVIGFAKITRDITERLQTREKLNASETRLRQLLDAVVDYAIFQLDRDGYVLTWNTGAQRIKGYTADEIIGQHFSLFYPDEERQAGIPARARDRCAGRPV